MLNNTQQDMKILIKFLLFFLCALTLPVNAKEDYFDKAKNLFEEKKYEDAKFLLQRNIVFNPKNSISYLYLAKIYNFEKNEKEEEKNLNTTLLLEPDNEEAMYMLIDIELKRSNFSTVEELTEKFEIICSTLCKKTVSIKERLNNIQAKEES